ncbi:class F sortase [Gordonia sp. DT30]|uniref:class F sortase n=1 Tax=unclassified Gordonia (in: high G+C Gram-positive bacteria) TaxID=2657482 RepID=UPI003CF07ACD
MTTTPSAHRSVRHAAVAVAVTLTVLLIGLLVGGCGSTGSVKSANPSAAQQDLPVPVKAHTDDPGAPVSVATGGGTAQVDAVATDTAGALLPPQDVTRLGWWVDSALPGSGKGTVVITGHIDEAGQGKGFAARFADLAPGAEVQVTTANREQVAYRVTRVQTADKHNGFPATELNRLDGPETLALVTCGGPFIGPPLGYADNIIAWASRG